jgi:RNA polymerase sigma-70 factor (ECF subfamily)
VTIADREWVERLLSGDERAFHAFFDEYYDRLYRFVMARTQGNVDMSTEVAQRTLCRAVRNLHLWRGDASLFSWLAQIGRNELADLADSNRRYAQRHPSFDQSEAIRTQSDDVADPAASAGDRQQAADSALVIAEVLDELPGRYGDVLRWKYLDELPVEDIAQKLGGSFESAQSMLARARLSFRSALQARNLSLEELLP